MLIFNLVFSLRLRQKSIHNYKFRKKTISNKIYSQTNEKCNKFLIYNLLKILHTFNPTCFQYKTFFFFKIILENIIDEVKFEPTSLCAENMTLTQYPLPALVKNLFYTFV